MGYPEKLTLTLEQLEESEAQELLVGLNTLYELSLEGHSPEAAEQIYLQQYGGQDASEEDVGGDGADQAGYTNESSPR